MKKKSNLPYLFKEMGPFKICLFFSVIFAALSAIASINAYTYVYKLADEIISKVSDSSSINGELVREYGKSIVFMICGGFGMYGLSLFFSHITAFNTAARLKMKLIRHIGKLPIG